MDELATVVIDNTENERLAVQYCEEIEFVGKSHKRKDQKWQL